MSNPLVILLIVSGTSVVTFTAGQAPGCTPITTPRPFSTTADTTPRPFSTTAITTPRLFSTAVTTPRPLPITTPRPFSTTTTPRECLKCHPDAQCEIDPAHPQCVCKAGFTGDGFSCSDIDECADSQTHNCSVGTCQNTDGSYVCLCPSGFVHLGGSCVSKCADPILNQCHPLAKCIGGLHNYSCVCLRGYYGNGFLCDTHECNKVWSFGMDCAKINNSYHICFDPCGWQTVLNEPWRSVNYTLSPTQNCDWSKNGWYQFVGNGGVRIPEYCVPEGRCSADSPVWMKGTHPVIADGIVYRTACANSDGDCCRWSSTILVKACPRGYHVYKFIGTPGSTCSLSYCTDASTRSCKADEEWQLRDQQYGCFCKSPYKVTALSQMVPEKSCGLLEMSAAFHKCQMNDVRIHFNETHVKDNACYDYRDDPATNTFSVLVSLQAAKCGVQIYITNRTHIKYTTVITIVVEPREAIVMDKTLRTVLQCAYELDMIAGLQQALNPIISSTYISVRGVEQLKVYMALYKDSGYTKPHTGSEVTLSTEDVLYVGVFFLGGPSNLVLVMKNCYATPTTYDGNDPQNYHIIQNSCPNKANGTVSVLQNGVASKGRFSVKMFKLVGNSDRVYLHCALSLCDSRTGSCAPICIGSGSPSGGTAETFDAPGSLTIGPIERSSPIPTTPQSGSSVRTSSHIFWTLLIPTLIILIQSL